MTARFNSEILAAREEVVAPPAARACEDQTFELPTGLYVGMALCFASFIAVLAISFTGGMAVSYGIVFAFLAAFFAVPVLMIRAKPGDNGPKALGWQQFREYGIATATGNTPAKEATILVLLLPFLIMMFGIAVATIAAHV
jgi:hypothetical protein